MKSAIMQQHFYLLASTFRGKTKEPFHLVNTLYLTREFFCDNFIKFSGENYHT